MARFCALVVVLTASLSAPLLSSSAKAQSGEARLEGQTARFLISIGYNAATPDPRPTLQFADDDAARFFQHQLPTAEKAWLLSTFDRTTAAAYPGLAAVASPPTKTELARALGEVAWLARARKAEGVRTELVFYFAGHGDVTPAGEGYLVLADGRLTRTDLFQQVVQGSPTDINHLLLDACASYFMVSPRGEAAGQNARPLSPELLNAIRSERAQEDPVAWARTGVIVSTSSSAAVHETAALSSGIFSYLLRSGLAGAADLNHDGRIEYGEVAGFIASASSEIVDPRARLQVYAAPPAQRPHAALADLNHPGFNRFLRVAKTGPRRLRILDARGLPYAEIHRETDTPVTLALVGGRYFVVQQEKTEALLVPRAPGAYALYALEFYAAPSARALRGPAAGLFSSAFGNAFAGGYFAASTQLRPQAGPHFSPAYAETGEPPLRLTPMPFAVGAIGIAGASTLLSAAALALNLYFFFQLQRSVAISGTVDPTLATAVEFSRLAAYSAAGVALVAAATGGGLGLWAWFGEAGE